jgi:AhpC/TSA family
VFPYLLFVALFQEPASPARIPLLDDCSGDSRVLATLSLSDVVQVRSSRSGEAQTCYTVSARVGGQDVAGYVLGDALPAVKEFERLRAAVPPPLPPPPPPVAATPVGATSVGATSVGATSVGATSVGAAPVAAAVPILPVKAVQHYRKFGNFSATDVRNRSVSLGGLQGKLILVCFWSPNNQESSRELILVSGLYSRLHRQGLDAVGISLDLNRDEILDSISEFSVAFPNIADRYGLAGREGIDSSTLPVTFILNQQHEVVASGLHKSNLQSTVLRLMKEQ